MAIRKDIDDMLNNLKTSGDETEHNEVHKKSIYDEMSVDDILSALSSEEKKPSLAEDILHELEEEIHPKKTDVIAETKSPEPAVEPEQPVQEVHEEVKKKKIIITGELPDYEALRREELEKAKLEKVRAEERSSFVNRHADDISEYDADDAYSENFADVQDEPAIQLNIPEPELPPVTNEPMTEVFSINDVREAERAAELMNAAQAAFQDEKKVEIPEEKPKKGFFSRIKSVINADDAELSELPDVPAETPISEEKSETEENYSEDTPVDEYSPEEPVVIEETFISSSDEPAEDTNIPDNDEPEDAVELLDAALAAIHNEEAAQELIEDDIAPAEEELQTTEFDDEDDDVGEDRVDSLIDGIRENAANAIAELEKPKEKTPADDDKKEPEKAVASAPEEEAPKKQGKLTSALGSILNEDPEELIAERKEHTESDDIAQPKVKEKGRFKKRLFAVLGVVFALFAVVGIITVAGKAAKMVHSFTSGEVKKDGFTEVIYPVVIMDIESFNEPSELSSEQIITASIWSIIMDDEKVSKYPLNAGGDTISISAYDVEAQAVELFGPDHKPFEHTTVGPVESKFFYDTDTSSYNVKIKPITFTYEPEIKSIVKSGDSYTVSVDYIDELPSWMEKSVAKTVEFHLTEQSSGKYRIDSMNIKSVKSSH